MKINFNENESYEINISNEVNAEEFLNLLERFENLSKLIKLNNPNQPKKLSNRPTTYKTRKKVNTREWCDTREKVLDLMQYNYHGSKSDRERIKKICGQPWVEVQKSFYGLKKRYDIKPNEVGLNTWERNAPNKFIPNWIIKSYTGYFDEK